jgi:hypothetical protein
MPRKTRQLVADLIAAGFVRIEGRGIALKSKTTCGCERWSRLNRCSRRPTALPNQRQAKNF